MRGISVGIDMGSAVITTAVLEVKKDGRFRVLGVGRAPSAGMRKGSIVDVEDAAHALQKSLADAARESGVAIRRAYVGLGGVHLVASPARSAIAVSRADGEVTEEDVQRVIQAAGAGAAKNPNREVVHVIPRQFKVDGETSIAEPVGLVGMKLEADVLVIDASKPSLQNLIRASELAGLEITDWMSSALAASEVAINKKQKELGVMLLDLGADTSDFAVFEEGRLVDLGSFPIGGNHITSDIAIGFRTPVPVAETIKVRYANASFVERPGSRRETIAIADFVDGDPSVYHVRDLGEIVSARLTDVFELALKALKKTGRAGLLPGGVVLTGGGADIPGIQELARRELKLPIEITRAIARDELDEVIPPRLAIPVGLVLWHAARTRENSGALVWRSFGDILERAKHLFRAFIP